MSDVLIAGGGLAGGLLAWRLAQARPELSLQLVEAESHLGGNHTWSFHSDDLTPAQHQWLSPLVDHSWDGYEVRFPSFTRRVAGGYHTLTSALFHRQLLARLGRALIRGVAVTELGPRGALLEGGRELEAGCVIDARGLLGPSRLPVGWQVFLGQELELERNHGLEQPILMDATVPQEGGFRFFYVLPLGRRRLLVEDTRYVDAPELPRAQMRRAIAAYAEAQGFAVGAMRREEEGALAIPLGGNVERLLASVPEGVGALGVRAGLFNPTTGYSLAYAVRAADALAERRALDGPGVAAWSRRHAHQVWERGGFCRFLNRMLFKAAEPEQRWRVLAHFYSMPDAVVKRFYAGRLTRLDQVRLLSGRPPVSIRRAARCFAEPELPA